MRVHIGYSNFYFTQFIVYLLLSNLCISSPSHIEISIFNIVFPVEVMSHQFQEICRKIQSSPKLLAGHIHCKVCFFWFLIQLDWRDPWHSNIYAYNGRSDSRRPVVCHPLCTILRRYFRGLKHRLLTSFLRSEKIQKVPKMPRGRLLAEMKIWFTKLVLCSSLFPQK